ncbi:response regulator [Paenibacillus senegalimassiliensis]|uniref:response regulator n=1 Tax=Paenibacillus senegalimassiliensis TaxID=1737426 RepID=UPI00073F7E2D|nr:response regulator [Paenibacillus senegalimassiliensis]
MYKAIIVDDEESVREGLQHHLDWQAFDIEVVGTAQDGVQALALVEEVLPDIVVTDVRMPQMDGIQLTKQLSARNPFIKIVFVSGHDDVDYLRNALQVKAIDYILKPVRIDELHEVIESVIKQLQAEEQGRLRIADMRSKLSLSMPLLREKFLMSLIKDGLKYQPDQVQERLEFLGLKLPVDADYWIISVSLDGQKELAEQQTEASRQLVSYAIMNVCQELIDQYMGGYIIENRDGEYIGILWSEQADDPEDGLYFLATEIRDNLERWLGVSVTIGVGERVNGLAELPLSYSYAREAVQQKWYLGGQRIITLDHYASREDEYPRVEHGSNDVFVSAMRTGDAAELKEELRQIFGQWARHRHKGVIYVRNITLEWLLIANRLLIELQIHDAETDSKEKELFERLYRLETLSELEQAVTGYLLEICEKIRDKRRTKPKNAVERIRQVIGAKYGEDLSIEKIAEEVFLSPTYMCFFYKQETGETVVEYLTKVRMEKAKEMLRDPAIKFYEIASKVGYMNPSYFSKLFKKHTGVTPSAYRNEVL